MVAPPKKARVIRIVDPCSGTRCVELEMDEALDFVGGQYLIVKSASPLAEGQISKRAYSILSPDSQSRRVEWVVKRLATGPGSGYVHSLEVGDPVEFSGPWGKFYPMDDDPSGSTLIVATDTGITAALGLVLGKGFAERLDQTRLLWLVPSEDYLLPVEEVRNRLPDGLAEFQVESVPPVAHFDRLNRARVVARAAFEASGPVLVYLVGDGDVVGPIQKDFMARGIDASRVRTEFFFNNPKKKDPKKLRTGFTTGACSAAAAKAAARVLVTGKSLREIETTLPNQQRVTFALERCEQVGEKATCSVIKDAGDDPDCTHGAELIAEVALRETPGIELHGGEGVAQVTQPGLGLEVGTSAINPVPRKNITAMVNEELVGSPYQGAEVTIRVPRGEEMARQTINDRLGLVGGISILGTTGIVKPYSTAAFRASVIQQIDLAAEVGLSRLVFTTGGKTETYAMQMFSELSPTAFVQVGDFIGAAVRHCAKRGVRYPTLVGMMGKMSKMADGQTMTHAAGSQVNMGYLAGLASEVGAPGELVQEIEGANTARHVLELCEEAGVVEITSLIARDLVGHLTRFARGEVEISAYMVSFEGDLLGQYPPEEKNEDE